MTDLRLHTEEDFWSLVGKGTSCWEWLGHTIPQGYGRFGFGGRKQLTHRLSWQFVNGPIPYGMFVLHRCDNPPCVNPEHLFLGTQLDNMRDMSEKGRHVFGGTRGSRVGGAKLVEADIPVIRQIHTLGFSYREIGDLFGVTQSNIHQIIRGNTWKHV